MNLIKNKKKINLIYFLLLIPVIFFIKKNNNLNNDTWFLLNTGRYVLNHGIPHIEPFSIHKGLEFVMPQWLSALFFFLSYNFYGKIALVIFVAIIGFIILYMYYKLCYLISENKILSIICTILMGLLGYSYIVSRPQIFTYLFLIFELFFLEKYIKTKNIKYLFPLPLISILLINFHATMWSLLFVYAIPYIINGIKIKKLDFKLGDYKIIPIIITLIIMFISGLINPYGFKAIKYLFNSYGIKEINLHIEEMKPLQLISFKGLALMALVGLIILIINYWKDKKLDLRYILLLGGTSLLALLHVKCWPYFVIIYFLLIASLFKSVNFEDFLDIKYGKIIKHIMLGIIIIWMIILFGITIFTFNTENDSNRFKEMVDKLLDDYNVNDIVMYVDYNNGGYTEFRGIKSYIDPRAETFLKANNKKEDILLEFYDMDKKYFSYENFVNKYGFTHLVVKFNTDFDHYLNNKKEVFKNIFTVYEDDEPTYNLYARKDLEVKS